ncbi:MAG: hypothetical protein HW414_1526 [Dehalococcoidia bacterium]|nr:hypothetical protein [Dehalococcoidia bacterium]
MGSVMVKDLKLEAGCRVAVVGGGPAGSFFALYLLQYVREAGLDVKVHIYQERAFSRLGPRGCKGCAGILSGTLLQNIKELGLAIPEEVIQSRITCYRLYSANGIMEVCNPQPEQDILSVYRGGGPRLYAPAAPISFDDFLLKEAQRRGATVFPQRVRRLLVYPRPTLEVGQRKEYYEAAVLAGGVNTLPVDMPDLDVRPAATLQMVQDELHARREDIQAYLGTKVQVFFIPGANAGEAGHALPLSSGLRMPAAHRHPVREGALRGPFCSYRRCAGYPFL